MRAVTIDQTRWTTAMDAASETEFGRFVAGAWARLFRSAYALTGGGRLAEDARAVGLPGPHIGRGMAHLSQLSPRQVRW